MKVDIENNELVKELCAPAPDAKDLYFPVDYAQCAWKQFTTGKSCGRIGETLFHFIKVPARATELYLDVRRTIKDYVKGFAAPSSDKIFPDLAPQEQHVFTLVLDLNETLIYSDWKRDPTKVIYLSGRALETCLQCENALPIKPWKLEPDDTTLLDIIPFFEYVAHHHPHDLREVLASYHGEDIVTAFRKRTKEHQRQLEEQKQQGRF